MVTEDASVMTNAPDQYRVVVLFSRDADGAASVPLGPEALGYLTATSDGYMFVRSMPGDNEILQVEHSSPWWTVELEESCF